MSGVGRLDTCSECHAVVEEQYLRFHQEWHNETRKEATDD